VNVKNGILDMGIAGDSSTPKLLPHTPNHLSIVQLPVTYDPTVFPTAWVDFITGLGFPAHDGSLALMCEILGYLICSDRPVQQSIWFKGAGGNGKSTLILAIQHMLGLNNTASVSVEEMETDKFAVADLYGKLANLCADNPSTKLDSSAMFKRVSGGDHVRAQRKYGQPFVFHPFCKLLFSGNSAPQSKDGSHAFFRRWVIVPFEKSFDQGSDGTVEGDIETENEGADQDQGQGQPASPVAPPAPALQDSIISKLTTPAALSGALNLAIEGWHRLHTNRKFTIPARVQYEIATYRAENDPIEVFIKSNYFESTVDPLAPGERPPTSTPWCSKDSIRLAYNQHAQATACPMVTDRELGRWVARYRPGWRDGQRLLNGSRIRGWWGVREKTLTEQLEFDKPTVYDDTDQSSSSSNQES
jgi:putative DNA primase/helicase